MTRRPHSDPATRFASRFAAALSGARALALLPLALLVVLWTAGPGPLAAVAAVFPAALALALGASLHSSGLAARLLGRGPPRTAEEWLDRSLLRHGATPQALAVIAVSVDDMIRLEQRIGPDVSETITRELAQRFSAVLRSEDLVVRGVHSDLLVCVDDIRAPASETLGILIGRLKSVLKDPFVHGTSRVFCTITAGVVRGHQLPWPRSRRLIREAESLCLEAQKTASDTISFYKSSQGTRPPSDGDLSTQVAAALEAGEIVGWYQPQVSTDTGAVTGFEALARWEHPTRGLISPVTFLDIIERRGLSQRLAEVVLTHALSALRAWDRAGLAVPTVSVNFAMEELRNPKLPDLLAWELDRHGVAPNRFCVEVLEHVIADDFDDIVARNLRALAALGCRIDLDDFGTGSTSIMNIRRFSVSRIKIDRMLVSRIDREPDQRDIVAGLLALAERLRVETLAEGVETQAEHAMLAQLGCHHVQGFSIARPMPLGDTFNWLQNRAHMLQTDLSGVSLPGVQAIGD